MPNGRWRFWRTCSFISCCVICPINRDPGKRRTGFGLAGWQLRARGDRIGFVGKGFEPATKLSEVCRAPRLVDSSVDGRAVVAGRVRRWLFDRKATPPVLLQGERHPVVLAANLIWRTRSLPKNGPASIDRSNGHWSGSRRINCPMVRSPLGAKVSLRSRVSR